MRRDSDSQIPACIYIYRDLCIYRMWLNSDTNGLPYERCRIPAPRPPPLHGRFIATSRRPTADRQLARKPLWYNRVSKMVSIRIVDVEKEVNVINYIISANTSLEGFFVTNKTVKNGRFISNHFRVIRQWGIRTRGYAHTNKPILAKGGNATRCISPINLKCQPFRHVTSTSLHQTNNADYAKVIK